jgi:hypothetical protein
MAVHLAYKGQSLESTAESFTAPDQYDASALPQLLGTTATVTSTLNPLNPQEADKPRDVSGAAAVPPIPVTPIPAASNSIGSNRCDLGPATSAAFAAIFGAAPAVETGTAQMAQQREKALPAASTRPVIA